MEIFLNCLKAFLIGGAICAVGQILIDKTAFTPARILVLFMTVGMALYAVGLYGPFAEFAGEGALLPISGFGSLLGKGAVDAVKEKGLIGALTGGLSASSAGVAAAVFFGFLAAVFFRPGRK